MGRKQKDMLFVLIAIIGLLGYLFMKVFEVVYNNWFIVLPIIVVAVLLVIRYKDVVRKNDRLVELNGILKMKLKVLSEHIKSNHNNNSITIEKSKQTILTNLSRVLSELDEVNNHQNDNYVIENDNLTHEFLGPISELGKILKSTYDVPADIWKFLQEKREFPEISPKKKYETELLKIGLLAHPRFFNEVPTIEKELWKSKKEKELISKAENDFKMIIEANKTSIDKLYKSALDVILKEKDAIRALINQKQSEWLKRENDFLTEQEMNNEVIEKIKVEYYNKSSDAIEVYCQMILEKISYNSNFIKECQTAYNPRNKILIIEYLLPAYGDFPNIKEIRYLKTKNEYKNIYLSKRESDKLYDTSIYKICLDSINKIFLMDKIDAVGTIVFNGYNNSINPATGKSIEACIISVQCDKSEFLDLGLDKVDPKTCFKKLKGIAAPQIIDLIPVKPIQTISRADKRFVSGEVVEIDSRTNLAAMDWKDFEYLIRQLFEKEFSSGGGEVKVTQSTRDGGVDAVAFDPDPLKGGKIIIQAKRYTNTVGINAVRELYGTLQDEGAMKGIIVTTSDYGPEAYKFAKDKPLTLINGENLLYYIEKHNYKAKIDIEEAKRINKMN